MTMYDVMVTEEVLLSLDGKVSEADQRIIDELKEMKNMENIEPLVAKMVIRAKRTGEFYPQHANYVRCEKCGKLGYVQPKYERGFRKGEPNYNKKVWNLPGWKTAGVSLCSDCGSTLLETVQQYIIENKLPVQISLSKTLYIKEHEKVCFQCKEPMWEFDMGLEMCLMGDGYYYATCHRCGAKSLFLGSNHSNTKNWRLVRLDELVRKKNCYQRG